MKNNRVIIGIALLIAILIVTVGFATINAVTLMITGSAKATGSDTNFKVAFTGDPVTTTVTGGTTTATIIDDDSAEMSVSGLTKSGDTATATYDIKNNSTDLSSVLTVAITQPTNSDYFQVGYEFIGNQSTIAAGGTAQLKVTVTLLKTPVNDQTGTSGNFVINITANPQEA